MKMTGGKKGVMGEQEAQSYYREGVLRGGDVQPEMGLLRSNDGTIIKIAMSHSSYRNR